MTAIRNVAYIKRAAFAYAFGALALPLLTCAAPVLVSSSGTTAIPALEIPSSALMSEEGNRSRVEHILLKRSLKGQPTAELYQQLFGPGLERAQAAFPVVTRESSMAGVRVLIYEPRAGVTKANADRVLINLHGGGFVACFSECGGMESIPIATLMGLRVISVDYRMAPAVHYPAATDDVVAVYREILKHTRPSQIGLFGCSAGGLLTAQSLARFANLHLPMPAAAGIFCAGGDAAMGGDSRIVGNLLGDGEAPEKTPTGASNLAYMTGASPQDSLPPSL
jgi:monoterpene epsilon-lactone hydrolase